MIIGVGCDLMELDRFEKSCAREHFLARCFSEKERAALRVRQLAGNFAAKEAFSKALGTGVRGFSLCEVSVLRDGLGAPYFEFDGAAAEIMESKRARALVSMSDTDTHVCAFVVLEETK